jgi:hypothetical protein
MTVNSASPNTIIFIDSTVPDYLQLAANILPDTEVFILDANRDGVEQITEVLGNRQNIASVQIVSHGSQGRVFLGNTVLDEQTLQNYTPHLQLWGNALNEDGDILLLGCNVASGETGQTFIEQLSQIAGADVAASENVTGNAAKGGDWELEAKTGEIETALSVQAGTLQAYSGTLAVGVGLLGTYYYDDDFEGGIATTQIDPTINFNWGGSETIAGKDVDGAFSVKWTGALITDGLSSNKETYDFKIRADDGVRLWIYKPGQWQTVIDEWTSNTTGYGSIELTGGKGTFYPIRIDYQDTGGDAEIHL